jgi:hypothetical protein
VIRRNVLIEIEAIKQRRLVTALSSHHRNFSPSFSYESKTFLR